MRPEDGEDGDGTQALDVSEESASRLEPISSINPQRPTERRDLIAMAKRTVAAARQRRAAAG